MSRVVALPRNFSANYALLRPTRAPYKKGMKMVRRISYALAASAFCVTAQAADFTGEVLVAPPPPNWDGGTPVTSDAGVTQSWKRLQIAGSTASEVVSIRTIADTGTPPVARIKAAVPDMAKGCVERAVAPIQREKANIGTLASITVSCKKLTDAPDGTTLFAMGRTYVGEFNSYVVTRTWTGGRIDPGSPANSPRTAAQWLRFFDRIAVCNTLRASCDPADAAMIHAAPRFTTMRDAPVQSRPEVSIENVMTAATLFGELTGRAEACGEDTTAIKGKIARMFAYITTNDAAANDAVLRFEQTLGVSAKQQATRPQDTCGQILVDFRAHPTRVSAFPRYIERFWKQK